MLVEGDILPSPLPHSMPAGQHRAAANPAPSVVLR